MLSREKLEAKVNPKELEDSFRRLSIREESEVQASPVAEVDGLDNGKENVLYMLLPIDLSIYCSGKVNGKASLMEIFVVNALDPSNKLVPDITFLILVLKVQEGFDDIV